MKKKLQFTLVTVASLFCVQAINAQVVSYNFENVAAGATTTAPSSIPGITIQDGGQGVVSGATVGLENTSKVLHASAIGVNNSSTVSTLTNFPTTNANYSVTWRETLKAAEGTALKKGFILRGTADISGWQAGVRQGYFFMIQTETNGFITFRIMKADASTGLPSVKRVDNVDVGMEYNKAMYFRATAKGNFLKLEYSKDGITFLVGAEGEDLDASFPAGGITQLVTGVGNYSENYYYDDITYRGGASLGVQNVSLNEKSFSVFKNNNTINISSTDTAIKSVQLFDANGRVIATNNNVNALETSFSSQDFAKGLILVQITGANNKVSTVKLVN